MQVTIILVNYNTKRWIIECLASVYKYTALTEFEVVVIDNNSSDGSREAVTAIYPEVIWIANTENAGFGAANNKGIRVARGKYIFLLNTDTVLLNDAVSLLRDFMDNPENAQVGCVGPYLKNGDGGDNTSAGRFPTLFSYFLENLLFLTPPDSPGAGFSPGPGSAPEPVDYIIGAAMFWRAEVLRELKGFDTDFFLFYEEAELCLRLSRTKFGAVLIPGPQIVHYGGGASNKDPFWIFRNYKKSEYLFFYKAYGKMRAEVWRFLNLLRYALIPDRNYLKRLVYLIGL